ncbi:MAG: radical SAM protein [Clostridia bacterium]|nr:radical SAM protein [Clostridia bacterium]
MMPAREEIKLAFNKPLEDLLSKAWSIRKEFHPQEIKFYAPGTKHYETANFKNDPWSFVAVSITGEKCTLKCDHCRGNLLKTMHHVNSTEELVSLGNRLLKYRSNGVLISGGADLNGEVPLLDYEEGISYLKKLGLKVIVHTGLMSIETASMLKRCGVDQVLVDIIGHKDTINKVYHLNRTSEDFERTLSISEEYGLNIAPHMVIGLDYGSIVGEIESIYMLSKFKVQTIVLVVLVPLKNTPMAGIKGPELVDAAKVIALARIYNPQSKLLLGCARPPGKMKALLEDYAIKAGVNGIAYPSDEAVKMCNELGFPNSFSSQCCSIP